MGFSYLSHLILFGKVERRDGVRKASGEEREARFVICDARVVLGGVPVFYDIS